MVDGIRASTFVSLQSEGGEVYAKLPNGGRLPFSQHDVIHMYTSPFCLICMVGQDACNHYNNEDGILSWIDIGMKFVKFAEKQNPLIHLVFLVLFLFILGPIYAAEATFHAAPMAFLAMPALMLVKLSSLDLQVSLWFNKTKKI